MPMANVEHNEIPQEVQSFSSAVGSLFVALLGCPLCFGSLALAQGQPGMGADVGGAAAPSSRPLRRAPPITCPLLRFHEEGPRETKNKRASNYSLQSRVQVFDSKTLWLLTTMSKLELQREPDDGSNAESGSSNPVAKSRSRSFRSSGFSQ